MADILKKGVGISVVSGQFTNKQVLGSNPSSIPFFCDDMPSSGHLSNSTSSLNFDNRQHLHTGLVLPELCPRCELTAERMNIFPGSMRQVKDSVISRSY